MVENKAFSGPIPQVFPTGPSVAIRLTQFNCCCNCLLKLSLAKSFLTLQLPTNLYDQCSALQHKCFIFLQQKSLIQDNINIFTIVQKKISEHHSIKIYRNFIDIFILILIVSREGRIIKTFLPL